MGSTSNHNLYIPPMDASRCVKVTTVAAEPMVHASPAGIFPPPSQPEEMKRLQYQTKYFTETDIKDFAAFLEQGMTESTGLVLVLIKNWHTWAFESLIDAFPNFPVRLLHEVNGGLSHTMLPVFGDDSMGKFLFLYAYLAEESSHVTSPELCYIMDNVDVAETPEQTYSRESMRLGLWEAQRMPVRLLS
ncbi:hypothetical protein THAR02_02915 [Trichoderma harzianum]|uniref:Uncharacterized protein n=1 Tax=Trichoderma harzianum TaxID=5544 RepID=A0A0F9XY69_TRIHA|nr:hypothetical protein THAR02_02915 [Trichoderma harzianum]